MTKEQLGNAGYELTELGYTGLPPHEPLNVSRYDMKHTNLLTEIGVAISYEDDSTSAHALVPLAKWNRFGIRHNLLDKAGDSMPGALEAVKDEVMHRAGVWLHTPDEATEAVHVEASDLVYGKGIGYRTRSISFYRGYGGVTAGEVVNGIGLAVRPDGLMIPVGGNERAERMESTAKGIAAVLNRALATEIVRS